MASTPINVEIDGVTYKASYHLSDQQSPLITVSSVYGTETTPLGNTNPDQLAKEMLVNIVNNYLTRLDNIKNNQRQA